jgi:hypothetical protein
MTDQLEVLFPRNIQVEVNDEQINLTPFKFGQINKVVKVATPMFGLLKTQVDLSKTEGEVGAQIMELVVTNGGDALSEVIQIATNKSKQWVDELDNDKVIELLVGIVEVNKDFFTKKVLPLIQKYLPQRDN